MTQVIASVNGNHFEIEGGFTRSPKYTKAFVHFALQIKGNSYQSMTACFNSLEQAQKAFELNSGKKGVRVSEPQIKN
jgi:hypothetical protein